MRFLPDNPSVDFLRQEAKDLLASLRETMPTASLTDAQSALAVQYGVRTWTELKAEVERRRTATPTAPDGLAEALAGAFGLGSITGLLTPVSFTPMGRCWRVTTDRGQWLASTVYGWINETQAENGARLRDAAVAAGLTAPTPVRSRDGRLIELVHGSSWRVHEWLDLGPVPFSPTSAAVSRRVGTIYGVLHSLGMHSEAAINPYLSYQRPAAEWEQLLDRARNAGKPWADRLAALLPALQELKAIEVNTPTDRLMLCNCNLIPEHTRLGKGDELVVTEWDFAGSLSPDLEIGSALTHWAFRPSINQPGLEAFVAGYRERAGALPTLNLSSFGVAVAGWLNWTYNTMCEAIDPPDADRAAFADLETADLLAQPVTRPELENLLDSIERVTTH